MGGLRDDTGSHNAKDVFGMGFGLDQTKNGVATVDDVYKVKLGQSSRSIGGKPQTEYSPVLGDPQVQRFLDRKTKSPFAAPDKRGVWSRLKSKLGKSSGNSVNAPGIMRKSIDTAQDRLAKQMFLSRPVSPN